MPHWFQTYSSLRRPTSRHYDAKLSSALSMFGLSLSLSSARACNSLEILPWRPRDPDAMDFTNREIATYLWAAVVLLGMLLWKPDVRRAFLGIIKAFVRPKIIALFGSATVYITLWLVLFASLGIWTSANVKTTII